MAFNSLVAALTVMGLPAAIAGHGRDDQVPDVAD